MAYAPTKTGATPDDPLAQFGNAVAGTVREVPGVLADAVGSYRDAEQGLARTINSHLPVAVLPVPPEGQATFIPPQTPPAAQPPDQVEPPAPPPAAPIPAPAGAPVPAGPQVVKTETESIVQTPEMRAAMARDRMLSAEQRSNLGGQSDARTAKIREDQKDQQAQATAESAQATADLNSATAEQAAIDKVQASYDASAARFLARKDAAEKQVDAANANAGKGYWADKSTGFKIVSALLTFSSVKSSYTLGEDPNDSPFMRNAREAIARDKEQKLSEVRRSKEYLEALRKGQDEARQFMLEARADIQTASARQLEISLKKAQAAIRARKADPARMQAAGDALIADEQAQSDEAARKLAEHDLIREAKGDRKVTTTAMPAPAGKPVPMVRWQGKDYTVSDEVDARELRKKAAATENLVGQLDQLAQMATDYDATPVTLGEKRAKIQAAMGRLTGKIKESDQLGALDNGVQTLVRSEIPDPTSIKDWLLKGGVKGTLSAIADLKASSVDSVNSRLAADPASRFQPPAPATQAARGGPSAQQLDAAIVKAMKAGDKEAVADLRARRKALGN